MVVQKLDKATLVSNHIIMRPNINFYFKSEIDEKHIKFVNGLLYTMSKINDLHLLNRKIFVRVADNKIETCLDISFIKRFDISFDILFIIDKCFYIVENDLDKIEIQRLLRKEKIKELLEL